MIALIASMLMCGVSTLPGEGVGTSITPSDSNLRYTGRWEQSNAEQPWAYWIGSSVIAEFEGTSFVGNFEAGSGSSPDYLRVIIDEDFENSTKIAVNSTASNYLLSSGLTDTVHTIEIVKETDVGDWTIHGFDLDPGRVLVPLGPRPSHKIEFYGDSNIAGYSLEHEENQSGTSLRGSYFGYGGIAARMLDAEYHNVSRSGATIGSINSRFDRMRYGSGSPTWDFRDFAADVVVVNLGANNVGSSVASIKAAYHAFLDDLRAVHPTAHIVLFNAWGWDYDEPANYTHEVIAERSDSNMTSLVFPWLFEQWHGCEYDHAGMALVLADHMTAVMGWNQSATDVMNGYGLNGDVANGGFEETAPFGGYGWRYLNDSGVARISSPVEAQEGERFLRLSSGASSHQPIPARAGETFVVNGWMRGSHHGDLGRVTIDFRDQEMWTTPLESTTQAMPLTTEWQQFSMTATAPSGTSNPVYHMRLTFEADVGDSIDVDGVGSRLQPGSGYCHGDGTASTCPCGANGAPGEGCANTGGVGGASLTTSGKACFGNDTFQIQITGIPGSKAGIAVKGSNQLAGGNGNLVGDGLLCTAPQLRSQVVVSDSSGNSMMGNWRGQAFGTYPGAANFGAPTYYQWWYRDPANPCSGQGFNFTNGWCVDWLP